MDTSPLHSYVLFEAFKFQLVSFTFIKTTRFKAWLWISHPVTKALVRTEINKMAIK